MLQIWISDGARLAGAVLAAGCLAWLAARLAAWPRASGALRHLRAFRPDLVPTGRAVLLGERLAARLPRQADLGQWRLHLAWAQRGGGYAGKRLGHLVVASLALGGCGLLAFLLHPAPFLLCLPFAAAVFPWVQLRAAANRSRRRAVRALPDIAVLVAAELAAGTAAGEALGRAAALPGPLSGLLAEVQAAGSAGRPIFGQRHVPGVLAEVFARTGLPQLRAFALQLDEVARKGVDSALLMQETARGLALEYRERVMMEKEQLDGRLTRHVAFHFFMPAVLLILAAFFLPMIALLSP